MRTQSSSSSQGLRCPGSSFAAAKADHKNLQECLCCSQAMQQVPLVPSAAFPRRGSVGVLVAQ